MSLQGKVTKEWLRECHDKSASSMLHLIFSKNQMLDHQNLTLHLSQRRV
jgi:hypothetical protein